MAKLLFGGIILLILLGGIFFLGFVVGTTVTPLAAGLLDSTAVTPALAEIMHATGVVGHV